MPHGLATWSRNAGSNQTIDSNAYLAEGQAASTINNAIRGAMASLAEWRDDNLYVIATRGTGNAYTATTYQEITSLADPFSISFITSASNTGPSTLNINGLGARSLVKRYGRTLGPDDLYNVGMVFRAIWLPSSNFFLIVAPDLVEPGSMRLTVAASPEPGWVLCDGRQLSRTDDASLFTFLGTTFGAGDGVNTFNVPDFRGRVPAGADNMGGTAASRLTGAVLAVAQGGQTNTILAANLPPLSGTSGNAGGHTPTGTIAAGGDHAHTLTIDAGGDHGHTATVGAAGAHTPSGTIAAGGDHTHTGTTGNQGADHSHLAYVSSAASGGGLNVLTPTVTGSQTGLTGVTANHNHSFTSDIGGNHAHTLTMNAVLDHTHTVTLAAAGNHSHTSTMGAAGNHSHTLTMDAVADHAHGLTVNATGTSSPFSVVQPTLAVNVMIKR